MRDHDTMFADLISCVVDRISSIDSHINWNILVNSNLVCQNVQRIFVGVVGGGDLCADVDGNKWTTYDR